MANWIRTDDRMLRRAIFISLVCHLAVLFSFRDAGRFADPVSYAARVALDARLQVPEKSMSALPQPNSLQPAPQKTSEIAGKAKARSIAGKVRPDLPPFSRSTATNEIASADQAGGASSAPTAASDVAAAQKSEISPEGVRQYRLNLAREARRFKRYPSLARERGWEGVVVVVVNTVAGGGVPQVGLGQSSGFALLDEEAQKLVLLAAQTAAVPDSLRNRQVGLTLPIHYRLED